MVHNLYVFAVRRCLCPPLLTLPSPLDSGGIHPHTRSYRPSDEIHWTWGAPLLPAFRAVPRLLSGSVSLSRDVQPDRSAVSPVTRWSSNLCAYSPSCDDASWGLATRGPMIVQLPSSPPECGAHTGTARDIRCKRASYCCFRPDISVRVTLLSQHTCTIAGAICRRRLEAVYESGRRADTRHLAT